MVFFECASFFLHPFFYSVFPIFFFLIPYVLQKGLIIFVVFPKEFRCVKSVRALFHACAAVEAVFHLLHLRLPVLAEEPLGRRAAEELARLAERVYFGSSEENGRELANKLLPLFLDLGVDVNFARIVDI